MWPSSNKTESNKITLHRDILVLVFAVLEMLNCCRMSFPSPVSEWALNSSLNLMCTVHSCECVVVCTVIGSRVSLRAWCVCVCDTLCVCVLCTHTYCTCVHIGVRLSQRAWCLGMVTGHRIVCQPASQPAARQRPGGSQAAARQQPGSQPGSS